MKNKKKLTIISVTTILIVFVIVASFFIIKEKESKNKVEEIKNITEENEIDTSNWKTYRNEEYGFEVKYPENFYEKEGTKKIYDKEYVYIGFSKNISITLTEEKYLSLWSVERKIKKMHKDSKSENGYHFYEYGVTEIAGKKAFYTITDSLGGDDTQYYVLSKGKLIIISWSTMFRDELNLPLLNKMIIFTK